VLKKSCVQPEQMREPCCPNRCAKAILWHRRATSGRTAPGTERPFPCAKRDPVALSATQFQRHSLRDSLACNRAEVSRPTVVRAALDTGTVRTAGASTSPSLTRLSNQPADSDDGDHPLPRGKPGRVHVLRQQLRAFESKRVSH